MSIRKCTTLAAAAFYFLLSTIALAAPSQESVERLLEASGLVKQVGEFPDQLRMGFAQGLEQGAQLPDELGQAMLESIDRAVLPSVILQDIATSVSAALTETEIQGLLQWYDTDTGRAITRAEEQASTPEASREMMEKAEELLADSERVEAAFRLDRLIGATDMIMGMQKSSTLAVSSAMMQAMAPEVPVNVEEFEAGWASVAGQMRLQLQQMVVLSFVYTYRSIDDDSLASYEEFLGQPAAQVFHKASMDGMTKGVDRAVTAWGSEIGAVIRGSAGDGGSTDV